MVRDKYGRSLAWVWFEVDGEGELLNVALVRAGLPIRLSGGEHAARLKQTEVLARKEGAGFWAEGGLEMTPAKWRKKMRQEAVAKE